MNPPTADDVRAIRERFRDLDGDPSKTLEERDLDLDERRDALLFDLLTVTHPTEECQHQ